jgi:hypothetical protein
LAAGRPVAVPVVAVPRVVVPVAAVPPVVAVLRVPVVGPGLRVLPQAVVVREAPEPVGRAWKEQVPAAPEVPVRAAPAVPVELVEPAELVEPEVPAELVEPEVPVRAVPAVPVARRSRARCRPGRPLRQR